MNPKKKDLQKPHLNHSETQKPIFTASWRIGADTVQILSGQLARWLVGYPWLFLIAPLTLPLLWVIICSLVSAANISWWFFLILAVMTLLPIVIAWTMMKSKWQKASARMFEKELQIQMHKEDPSPGGRLIEYQISKDAISWDHGSKSRLLQDFTSLIATKGFILLICFSDPKSVLVIDRSSISKTALQWIRSHSGIQKTRWKRVFQWLFCLILAALLAGLLVLSGLYPALSNCWMFLITVLMMGTVLFSWFVCYRLTPAKIKILECAVLLISLILPASFFGNASSKNEKPANPPVQENLTPGQEDQKPQNTAPLDQPAISQSALSPESIEAGYLAVLNSLSDTVWDTLPPYEYNAKGYEFITASDSEQNTTRIYFDRAHSNSRAAAFTVEQYPKSNGTTDLGSYLSSDTILYLSEDGSLISVNEAYTQGGDLLKKYLEVTGQNN